MRRPVGCRSVLAVALAVGTALGSVVPAASGASAGGYAGRGRASVLSDELSSPKGLAVAPTGDPVVGQGGFGPPGPVVEYVVRGRDRGALVALTDPVGAIDVAVDPSDGTVWVLAPDPATGSVHVLRRSDDGSLTFVADVTAYQLTDPDPVDANVPPDPFETNPYGMAVAPGGDVLVADAAGNDLLRITPEGAITTVARFDVETVATDHLPSDPAQPLPPTLEAEAVPTTVAIGPDGAIYVGELKGFPFRPGTSNIWRIEAGAEDAWCSVDSPDPTGACSLFSSGYTAIQDISFDQRTRRLYVLELAVGGVLAFEAGFDPAGPGFPPAVLLEVRITRHGERRTELAAGEISEPGGVVAMRGAVYVTDEVFSGGRLLRVRR